MTHDHNKNRCLRFSKVILCSLVKKFWIVKKFCAISGEISQKMSTASEKSASSFVWTYISIVDLSWTRCQGSFGAATSWLVHLTLTDYGVRLVAGVVGIPL